MALLTTAEVKTELGISDTTNDTYIGTLATAIESLWDEETGRTWESTEHTEYYNMDGHSQILMLNNYPVDSTATFTLYDDPDWNWSTAVSSTLYRLDYDNGILYYDSFFYQGKQSVKVVYTAGYSSSTLPKGIKQILVRQIAHWYHQGKHRLWDKDQATTPSGGGNVSYKKLVDNLLPEFYAAIEKHKKYRCR